MKTSRIFLIIICTFLFYGCEDALSCIIPKKPELNNNEFPIGSTETYYYTEVEAEIRNEPRDNDYDYYFDFEEPLPPGLDYFVNYRTISIEGVPELPGTYQITLLLYVEGPFRDDDVENILCENSTSKTFTLIVE